MMRILISGSSGMIGSVVATHLTNTGHDLVRLVRRQPNSNEVYWDPDKGILDANGLEGFDGVIHLASMPWPMFWTIKAKNKIRSNRITTNSLIADTLAARLHKPSVLICASGMGIYPSSGDQIITEDSPTGSDFLAGLQRDGETVSMKASEAGIRVVNLRIPAVIGGSMLNRNMGLMGSSQRWTSWVGLHEMAYIIEFVLGTNLLSGPINCSSPNPVKNAEFTKVFNQALGRKSGLSMPAFLLRLVFGEMAETLILSSRRMEPDRLISAGYKFHFPELYTTLCYESSGFQ